MLKYEYLDGPTGDPDHSDPFEATMNWRLDQEGHLALDLTYRNGEVTLGKV